MQLLAATLENGFVRLEPLADRHKAALAAACAADETIWRSLYSVTWAPDAFEASWAGCAAENAAGRQISFAVLAGGEVVGMTSYLAMDAANAALEIGATYYAQAPGAARSIPRPSGSCWNTHSAAARAGCS